MDYSTLKHAHAGLAYLSALLFFVRFVLLYAGAGLMKSKVIKIIPHVIDTFLLAFAIWLCVLISQYPLTDHWLTVKVLALVLLVGTGTVAIKRKKVWAAVVTLGLYGYAIGVAKTHDPMSWLALV
ncbi:MAG: regulator SirB [Oceanospirillaceae bacterium]|nr:regulator SirB [Oceanospirillaceae bacterium]|tara:strand:- start:1150 stop:1524 length:375 start_codon:yes stop_codon:yes gene_type:complete